MFVLIVFVDLNKKDKASQIVGLNAMSKIIMQIKEEKKRGNISEKFKAINKIIFYQKKYKSMEDNWKNSSIRDKENHKPVKNTGKRHLLIFFK